MAYDILGNPFIGGRTKSEHGKRKLGSVNSNKGALSHMSSYRKRKEAREALEAFVMKEELDATHKIDTNIMPSDYVDLNATQNTQKMHAEANTSTH